MHRGYRRLTILLTCVWSAFIFLIVAYQSFTQDPNCPRLRPYCQRFFWKIVAEGYSYDYVINGVNVLFTCIAPPIAGWILVAAIRWVKRGFDHED